MKCKNCYKVISNNIKFCLHCGHVVMQYCPSCSQPIHSEDMYCNECGIQLPKKEFKEKQYGDKPNLEILQFYASHALLAHNWQKAYDYSLDVANKLYDQHALKLSMQFYDSALTAISELPKTKENTDKTFHLYFMIYQILLCLSKNSG